jgi:hypothetical protein
MEIENYFITIKEMRPLCKSPSAWGNVKGQNMQVPLMFFKKPKWMSEKDFHMLVKSIQFYIPPNYNFEGDL